MWNSWVLPLELCLLPPPYSKFTGLSVQAVFILSVLAGLCIILFIVRVSTDRIHQLSAPCLCRGS